MDVENNKPKQSKPPKNEDWKKEKLSKEDLDELMGVNRQILHRKNGAWRRK